VGNFCDEINSTANAEATVLRGLKAIPSMGLEFAPERKKRTVVKEKITLPQEKSAAIFPNP
jgi:hypothetical protein